MPRQRCMPPPKPMSWCPSPRTGGGRAVHVPYTFEQDEDGAWCAHAQLRPETLHARQRRQHPRRVATAPVTLRGERVVKEVNCWEYRRPVQQVRCKMALVSAAALDTAPTASPLARPPRPISRPPPPPR